MAIKRLYGNNGISMQQLSATFRRGDLVEDLEIMDLFEELDGFADEAKLDAEQGE
jgi:hypothetical protein